MMQVHFLFDDYRISELVLDVAHVPAKGEFVNLEGNIFIVYSVSNNIVGSPNRSSQGRGSPTGAFAMGDITIRCQPYV